MKIHLLALTLLMSLAGCGGSRAADRTLGENAYRKEFLSYADALNGYAKVMHFGAPDLIRLTSAILPSSNAGKATASAGRASKSKEELMEEYIKENMIGNSSSLVDYSLTTSFQTTLK